METTTWGDPTSDQYRKKHIREAHAAGAEALVNAQILPIVQRLMEGLSLAEVEIPQKVISYDERGTEAQRVGLAIHLNIVVPPSEDVQSVVSQWMFDGFAVEGSDLIELRFVGDAAAAARLSEEAVALQIDRVEDPDVSGESPTLWPGVRDLELGDHGHDVRFLRLVLAVGNLAEPVDEQLLDAVRRFQTRRGAPVTGLIDADLWRRILPAGRPQVGQADSGFIIRVIQAALATYEDATTKVTGVWGILTTRDLTALQKEYNLRVGSFVRAPEWALLLGPVNPRIEEARRIAKGGVGFTIGEQFGQAVAAGIAQGIANVQAAVAGGGINPIAGIPQHVGLIHKLTPLEAEIVKKGGVVDTSINGVDTEHLLSEEHKPTQHRDGKEPWCAVCKLNADGKEPAEKKVDPKAPPKKRSTPRSAPKKTQTP